MPGESVLVFQPAALLRLRVATGSELLPVVVDLLLGLAVNLDRDRLVELEQWTSIERGESQAVELEVHRHHRAGGALVDLEAGFAVAGNSVDA